MDIGLDLFLQMLKGIHSEYTDELSKRSKEFLEKAAQNLFAEIPSQTLGYNAGEFFKVWVERAQEALAEGKPPIDLEMQNKITQRILQNGYLYMEFMNAVLEAIRATYAEKASDEELDEIYNQMSKHYLRFYQESVGKYLAVPKFGLPREDLHQVMTAVDAYNRFVISIGEFLVKFNTPLKRSLEILQQAIQGREGVDGGFKSAKEVYNFAVSILDKKYDDFLKSPEAVESVVNLVEKYLEYKKGFNDVKDIWLRSLSIPTKREMEDVYKGIYHLKKKGRKQEAIILEQSKTIEGLNKKIQEIEASLTEFLREKRAPVSNNSRRKVKTKPAARAPRKANV